MTPEKGRTRELLAAAWELEGALGLPFVVRDDGDLAVDPDALDEWWAEKRTAVMAAYDEHHPRQYADQKAKP
jgi:hypothetical protein